MTICLFCEKDFVNCKKKNPLEMLGKSFLKGMISTNGEMWISFSLSDKFRWYGEKDRDTERFPGKNQRYEKYKHSVESKPSRNTF